MNANDVIESYVTDVAVLLPRKQRNDVAFELRELLREEVQGRAADGGREVDAALATDFLQGFGRPEDIAARYRPTLTIIEPADGHAFLRATVIGLAVIWSLGLLVQLQQPVANASEALSLLGRWWTGTVIASLWWPGVLVVGFAIAAASRRRWPQKQGWQPLERDRIRGGRVAMIFGLVGVLCGVFVLFEPTRILDLFWGGRAAPVAYQALTYTDSFRTRQAPWIFALLLLNIPLFIAVIVQGRWTTPLRHAETAHSLVLCAVLAWTVADGPILPSRVGDQTAKFALLLTILFTLLQLAMSLYRSVRPAPDQRTPGHTPGSTSSE